MTPTLRILLQAIAILTLGSWLSLSVAADPPRSYRFDIEGQTLSQALRSYSQISRQEILFTEEVVNLGKTVSLKGEFTAEAALARLLEGTGLGARRSPSGAITIVRTGEGLSGAAPADQMRIAAIAAEERSTKEAAKEGGDGDEKSMVVKDKRIVPFSDRNVDLPRTINDAQPYYIFDAKTIEKSGMTDIGTFLKTRLTMNSVGETAGQRPQDTAGNVSSINLRGLGADETLVLINGRRAPGVSVDPVGEYVDRQPDLNGIPLSAIERIEVLPTSASGIYGGSAIGGVVNVILKRDYSGGEAQVMYDNTWDNAAPSRRISASLGRSLQDGKTRFMLTGFWSDADSLIFRDRAELIERGLRRMVDRVPQLVTQSQTNPFAGATPNIVSSGFFRLPPLVLRDGRSLNATRSSIPAGTSPTTSAAELASGLLANAGQWNFGLPASTQAPTGLLRQLDYTPEARSAMLTLNHRFGERIEGFLEASYFANDASSMVNPFTQSYTVPAFSQATPSANPFNAPVVVNFPDASALPSSADSVTRTVTAGLTATLGADWRTELDFTRSDSHFEGSIAAADNTAIIGSLGNGTLNPFVDTLLYPLDLDGYVGSTRFRGVTVLSEMTLRGSGPLMRLPWGTPKLTFGLGHRISRDPSDNHASDTVFPISSAENLRTVRFGQEQTTSSAYAELQVPLVKKADRLLLHGLDLQVAGRGERYTVDAGTFGYSDYPNDPSRAPTYIGPLRDGQPFHARDSYTSTNGTLGLIYQPLRTVTLRASLATAFLPPTPVQLISDPRVLYQFPVSDPVTHNPFVFVNYIGGGNPEVKPQNSKSFNAGLIWQPDGELLQGLRLNLEYYKIDQFDFIAKLGAQNIVNAESNFPGRVVRGSNGQIVSVTDSYLNLYERSSEGADVSLDYRFALPLGALDLHAGATHIMHEQRQLSATQPLVDYAGYVAEGGPAKTKANATAGLERGAWSMAWTATYFGSYHQFGSPGSPTPPSSITTGPGSVLYAQGANIIAAQIYHDLFLGYSFGESGAGRHSAASGPGILEGLTLQAGVKNIFNTLPPFDAYYSGSFYASPYGDKRLRSWWLSATKQF